MLEWKERYIVIRHDKEHDIHSYHVFKTYEEAKNYQHLSEDTDRFLQLTQVTYEIVKGKEIEDI